MQARLKKTELIAFKSYASQIKTNTELSTCGFIKVEIKGDSSFLTKTNLVNFVVSQNANDSEDSCFLVDENILFNFVELSDSEYINFQVNGIRIKIFDERHKTESPTELASLFPKVEINNNDWVSIEKSVLDAIGICAQVVFDDEISGLKNTVFVGDFHVAGSDGTIGYWQRFYGELPKLSLRKQVAFSISKLGEGCLHSYNESYDLFKINNSILGFSKSVVPYTFLPPFFLEPKDGIDFFINKSLLIKWNTFVINSCKSKILSATFKGENNRLNLELVDSKFEIDNKSHIDIVNGKGDFKFNPLTLNSLLKVLPSEQIYFMPGDKRYYLTDQNKTFMSAIMLTI